MEIQREEHDKQTLKARLSFDNNHKVKAGVETHVNWCECSCTLQRVKKRRKAIQEMTIIHVPGAENKQPQQESEDAGILKELENVVQ